MNYQLLSLDNIVQTHPSPDEKKIKVFEELIREEGLDYLEPTLCAHCLTTGKFYMIDGTHRSLGAARAGKTHIWGELLLQEYVDPSGLLR